ncbi:MAG: peptidylprolyl isomerase [Planctomycetes bacterium]|nr:peptidylprolyl isomerase [Planctomycetota bacterium]
MHGHYPLLWLVVLLMIVSAVSAQARPPEAAPAAADLASQIATARRDAVDPLPPAELRSQTAGQVNGEPLPLADVLDEAVLLYAVQGLEALARQRAMALEAMRRGIVVSENAFAAAVADVLSRRARGESLAVMLLERRIAWPRFEALMRMNVATEALFRLDHDGTAAARFEPDDPRGKAWVESVAARYEIVTDPARLAPGVYAHVQGSLPLRGVLERWLEPRAGLPVEQAAAEGALEIGLATLDGGRAVARIEGVDVTMRDAGGDRPDAPALKTLLEEWRTGRFRVRPPDPKAPAIVTVAPGAGGGLPEYRLAGASVAVRSEIAGDGLLALRIGDLKLRHLDEALESRARWVAVQQAMRERAIEVPAARIAARIERERARYKDGEFSWEQAIQLVGRNIHLETRRFWIADAVDQVIGTEAPEAELRAYHEAHLDHFGRATVTASHILIREEDPETGRIDFTRAREIIREVYAKLRAGAEFVDMVQQYSQDPLSRQRGGDVGMFTLVSAYDEDFCRLAFALEEGEISPPVRTRQGYHILYCRKRTPPDTEANTFERIRDIVREDRQEERRKRWLDANVYGKMKLLNRLDSVWIPGGKPAK